MMTYSPLSMLRELSTTALSISCSLMLGLPFNRRVFDNCPRRQPILHDVVRQEGQANHHGASVLITKGSQWPAAAAGNNRAGNNWAGRVHSPPPVTYTHTTMGQNRITKSPIHFLGDFICHASNSPWTSTMANTTQPRRIQTRSPTRAYGIISAPSSPGQSGPAIAVPAEVSPASAIGSR